MDRRGDNVDVVQASAQRRLAVGCSSGVAARPANLNVPGSQGCTTGSHTIALGERVAPATVSSDIVWTVCGAGDAINSRPAIIEKETMAIAPMK